MAKKLFEYAVIYRPTEKEREDGGDDKVVVQPKVVLAEAENQAILAAGSDIPAEFKTKLDRLEVAVRPF